MTFNVHDVHVFSGTFETRDEAQLYSEAQWGPEPNADASESEFDAWEACNPMWQLKRELGVYLDSDFIETIHGAHLFSYLTDLLLDPSEVDAVLTSNGGNVNTLVLIFDQALGGIPVRLSSTSRLAYLGEYCLRNLFH